MPNYCAKGEHARAARSVIDGDTCTEVPGMLDRSQIVLYKMTSRCVHGPLNGLGLRRELTYLRVYYSCSKFQRKRPGKARLSGHTRPVCRPTCVRHCGSDDLRLMSRDMESADDDQTLPPIPEQRTVFLVNTYIVHTVQLLNNFSALCEQKLAEVHRRILTLDTTVTLLESKLRSVEDCEGPGERTSFELTAEAGTPDDFPTGSGRPSETDNHHGNLSLPPAPSDQDSPSPSASSSASEQQFRPKVKDDPAYSRFFRMLQVGVPERAVKRQMTVEGFEPSLLDNPDAPVPEMTPTTGDGNDTRARQ